MDSRVRMKSRCPRALSGVDAVKRDARADPKGPTEAPEVPAEVGERWIRKGRRRRKRKE